MDKVESSENNTNAVGAVEKTTYKDEGAENNAGLVDKVESSENNTNAVGAVEKNTYEKITEKTTYKDESNENNIKLEPTTENFSMAEKTNGKENKANLSGDNYPKESKELKFPIDWQIKMAQDTFKGSKFIE